MTRTIRTTASRTVWVAILTAVLLATVGVAMASAIGVPPTTSSSLAPAAPNGENGWYVSAPQVTLTATSSIGTTISAIYHQYDATSPAGWVTYASPFSASLEGSHTLYFYSVDVGGATSTVGADAIRLDTVHPVIGTVWPMITNDRYAVLSAHVTDAGSGVELADSGPHGSLIGRSNSSFDATTGVIAVTPISPMVSGENVIYDWAEDMAGNVTTRYQIVTVDVTPPVVKDDHKASYILSADVDLYAKDTTGTGIASITYQLDGAATQTVAAHMADVHTMVVGGHVLTYFATDNAGNSSAPVTVTFAVMPVTAFITITNGPAHPKVGYAFHIGGMVGPASAFIQITRYHFERGQWKSYGRYNLKGRADGTWLANVSTRFRTPGSWKFVAVSGGASATWYVTTR